MWSGASSGGSTRGGIAFAVTLAMLVLMVTMVLPWTGNALGWEILAGSRTFGVLPRLFTFTSLGFGLVHRVAGAGHALVGAGVAHGRGVRHLRRQRAVGDLVAADRRAHRRHRPGIGMVLAAVTMVVLTACWARIAGRRG